MSTSSKADPRAPGFELAPPGSAPSRPLSPKDANLPLAARLRPQQLADVAGQQHLVGPGKPLARMLDSGRVHSMILWGPPGCGKTTLARVLADGAQGTWHTLSAVLAGVKDLREAVVRAQAEQAQGRAFVLFVDEIHRFNKAQQDALLPHVENGTLTLIGATTENPSFEVNAALLSRLRVYVLKPLAETDLSLLADRALPLLEGATLADNGRALLIALADGDARALLNLLDVSAQLAEGVIDEQVVREASGSRLRRFDKGGDAFYDQISALHKAVRGSAPDAALYWLARMLDGGCDPSYLARRITRMASEDIGLAEPRALSLCLAAWDAYERLGAAEGELALAQAVTYLAACPKSNAAYLAFKAARALVAETGSAPVPERLRNAPSKLAKSLGHGQGYRYAHDEPDSYAAGESYWPDDFPPQTFYEPTTQGAEARIAARLQRLEALDQDADLPAPDGS
jgi:putative ATPase